jgi:hypothetical protein
MGECAVFELLRSFGHGQQGVVPIPLLGFSKNAQFHAFDLSWRLWRLRFCLDRNVLRQPPR